MIASQNLLITMYVGVNTKNETLIQTLSLNEFDVQLKILSEVRSQLKENKQDQYLSQVTWENYRTGYRVKPVSVSIRDL